PATIAYFADQLVNGYGVDQRITDLVDGVAWQIVPLANPDGYEHTWDVDRLWRKTRRDNGDGTRGVDWNRNFSAGWGGPGSSGSTNSDIYRGTAPFSEPETQAIRADVLATPNLAIFLDVHCYSQLVLWPYGYDETEPAGPAGEIHRAIGIGIADAIASVNGVDFTPQAAHDLYLASGTSPDWGWDEAGAYSFTYELRDTGQFGFILPPDQIVPSGEEITESLLWTGEQVLGAAGVSFTSPLPAFADPASIVDVSISIVSTFAELDPSTALMVVENPGAVDRIPMSADAEGVYTASFLTGDCGSTSSIVFEIETIDGVLLELASSDGGPWQVDSIETETVFQDDAETDLGWTLGVPEDDATTGIWTRVDPNGTAAAPEDDDSDSGTLCFVTGQGSVGGGLGENDVDGGRTTLVSPVIPLDGGTSTERAVSFSLWYSNDTGAAPNSDSLLVETRWDGGSWLPLAEITESDASWRRTTLALEAPVAAPTSLEIRFIARDLGDGSLVEAAIDEVRILQTGCGEPECPGDLNEDGRVDGGDVGLLLSGWGGPGAGDLDGDGTVGGSDIGLLLSLWGDC
ncbi:MAG: M14 family zinc carboxypeptidase, partial [Planctomycetota bacterium]|nr:M14 family zinc carboxypeptidase [Planctomycetota bacterium]